MIFYTGDWRPEGTDGKLSKCLTDSGDNRGFCVRGSTNSAERPIDLRYQRVENYSQAANRDLFTKYCDPEDPG